MVMMYTACICRAPPFFFLAQTRGSENRSQLSCYQKPWKHKRKDHTFLPHCPRVLVPATQGQLNFVFHHPSAAHAARRNRNVPASRVSIAVWLWCSNHSLLPELQCPWIWWCLTGLELWVSRRSPWVQEGLRSQSFYRGSDLFAHSVHWSASHGLFTSVPEFLRAAEHFVTALLPAYATYTLTIVVFVYKASVLSWMQSLTKTAYLCCLLISHLNLFKSTRQPKDTEPSTCMPAWFSFFFVSSCYCHNEILPLTRMSWCLQQTVVLSIALCKLCYGTSA